MSPTIFTFYFDVLSRILSAAENRGQFKGMKISRQNPMVLHLMLVDDLTIFCRANLSDAHAINKCLQTYCSWSR